MATYDFMGQTLYYDNRLYRYWQKNSLPILKKTNSDRVLPVDGRERTGKSMFVVQQAALIDPDMFKDIPTFLSRICFTPDEFFNAVRTVKNGVIIFDEAFRGFSSRSALSKTNKRLIQALMEMGQNNNIVFIVLPSFFLLDIYPAMLRSDALFNIYQDKKSKKRCWRAYNKSDKNKIYQMGIKKGWTYAFGSRLKGVFYNKFPGGEEYERAYLDKKHKALVEMDKEYVNEEPDNKYIIQRDILIRSIMKTLNLSQTDMVDWLNERDITLSQPALSKILWKNMEIKVKPMSITA